MQDVETISQNEFMLRSMEILIWPLVILFIFWQFKREFKSIFKRAKSLKMGASGLEIETFEKTLNSVKQMSTDMLSATGKSKSLAAPADPFGPNEPKYKIAQAQIRLVNKLKKKASGNNIDVAGKSSSEILDVLNGKSAITQKEHDIANGLFELSDQVMSGRKVSSKEMDSILEIYQNLL